MSIPIPGKAPAHPAFEPSPAQRRLLDYVTAHPEFKTVTQFCAAADVPRSSYERWCREPGFRAWFIHEWASALMFEGWHVLTLARAHMVNSPVHFKAIFSLLFTPAGQSALAAWAEHVAAARDPAPAAPAPANYPSAAIDPPPTSGKPLNPPAPVSAPVQTQSTTYPPKRILNAACTHRLRRRSSAQRTPAINGHTRTCPIISAARQLLSGARLFTEKIHRLFPASQRLGHYRTGSLPKPRHCRARPGKINTLQPRMSTIRFQPPRPQSASRVALPLQRFTRPSFAQAGPRRSDNLKLKWGSRQSCQARKSTTPCALRRHCQSLSHPHNSAMPNGWPAAKTAP